MIHVVLGTALTPTIPSAKAASKEKRGLNHPYIFDLLIPPVLAERYEGDDEEKERRVTYSVGLSLTQTVTNFESQDSEKKY